MLSQLREGSVRWWSGVEEGEVEGTIVLFLERWDRGGLAFLWMTWLGGCDLCLLGKNA